MDWRKEDVAMFRISTYYLDTPVSEIVAQLESPLALAKHWSFHSIGDQGWLWFDFPDKATKDAYLASLPEKIQNVEQMDVDQATILHWTNYNSTPV